MIFFYNSYTSGNNNEYFTVYLLIVFLIGSVASNN